MASLLEGLAATLRPASVAKSDGTGEAPIAAVTAAVHLAALAEVTNMLLLWLPDFWALASMELPALASASAEPGFSVQGSTVAAEQTVERVLITFSRVVSSALRAGQELEPPALLDTAAGLAQAALELEAAGCPASAPAALQSLACQACELSTARLEQRVQRDARQLADINAWRATTDSDAGAALVGSMVDCLGRTAGLVMRHTERAAQLSALARLAYKPPLQALLAGCFSAATAQMGSVASAAMQMLTAGEQSASRHAAFEQRRQLLCCAGVVGAARSQLLPRLAVRWAPVLQQQGLAAAQVACATELEAAEQRFISSYMAVVQTQLDRLLEELLAQSAAAPPAAAVRSAAGHVTLVLAAVEVCSHAIELARRPEKAGWMLVGDFSHQLLPTPTTHFRAK